MYDRILFPTDGSEGADTVLEHVLDLAEQQGATLHVLNVADTTHLSVTRIGGDVVDALEQEGAQIVEETANRADSRNVPTVTDVEQGGVAGTIAAYAEEYDIDLIAMPTHGRTGLKQAVLGSITERVMRQSPAPVLVLPPDGRPTYSYQNILVPTDGSDCAAAALDRAVALASALGATLHVLTVIDVTRLGVDIRTKSRMDALEERANTVVAEAAATAEDGGVDSVVDGVTFAGSVTGGIESYAEDNDIDLVAIGTHGRTGVDRYLLGSVTERIVRTASGPVLTVPASQSASTD